MTAIISPIHQIKEYWKQRKANGNEVGIGKENIFRAAELVNIKIQSQITEKLSDLNNQVSSHYVTLPQKKTSPELDKQYKSFNQACMCLSMSRSKLYSNSFAEGHEKYLGAVEKLQAIAEELKENNINKVKSALDSFLKNELKVDFNKELENKKLVQDATNANKNSYEKKFNGIINGIIAYAREHLSNKKDFTQFKKKMASSMEMLKEIINVDAIIAVKKENEDQLGTTNQKDDNSPDSYDKHTTIKYWEDPASIANFFEFICKKPFVESYLQDTKTIIQEINLQYERKNAVKENGQPVLKPITQPQAHRLLMQKYGLKPGADKKRLITAMDKLMGGMSDSIHEALSVKIHETSDNQELNRDETPAQNELAQAKIAEMRAKADQLMVEIEAINTMIEKLKGLRSLRVEVTSAPAQEAPSFSRHAVSIFGSKANPQKFSQPQQTSHTTLAYPKMNEMHPLVLDLVKKLRFHIYTFTGKNHSGKNVTKHYKELNAIINTIAANGGNLDEVHRIVNQVKNKAEKSNPTLFTLFTLLEKYETEMKNTLESNAVPSFKVVQR